MLGSRSFSQGLVHALDSDGSFFNVFVGTRQQA